jgi:mRNA interferase RelE/StbE
VAVYKLLLKASAAKEIDAVGSKDDRGRIVRRIQALAANPRAPGCEKLAGHADRYRVRQGRFRVIYLVDDDRGEVTVFKVGHRKDIYR